MKLNGITQSDSYKIPQNSILRTFGNKNLIDFSIRELNENDVDNRNFDCHAKTNPMMLGIFMPWSLLRNFADSDHSYF